MKKLLRKLFLYLFKEDRKNVKRRNMSDMKRLMIITAVFALLLTGCGTRVSHDTLMELSMSSITEYQNRLNALHPKDLEVSIRELAQKKGLEPRTFESDGQIFYYSGAHLKDGTNYLIAGYDRKEGVAVLITIENSEDSTIPQKMCERIRSLALERGLGEYLIVNSMKNVVMLIIGEERKY